MEDSNFDCVGYDLDGVLCPDLNTHSLSEEEIVKAVQARYKFKPMFLPNHKHFYIVTGRPFCDYVDTYAWARNYFNDRFSLLMQLGSTKPLSIEESAQFKAQCVIHCGITSFVESCPRVAALLNDLVPPLNVIVFQDLCNLGTRL